MVTFIDYFLSDNPSRFQSTLINILINIVAWVKNIMIGWDANEAVPAGCLQLASLAPFLSALEIFVVVLPVKWRTGTLVFAHSNTRIG